MRNCTRTSSPSAISGRLSCARRISEDFRLLQRVGTAGNVEQLVGIYGKFWQQAVEDYAREYAAITKLAGVGIMPDTSASQRPDDASEPPPHLSKAA